MPLHDISIDLFIAFLGLQHGVYKVIIWFEDGVRMQSLQLPGSDLEECCCAAWY